MAAVRRLLALDRVVFVLAFALFATLAAPGLALGDAGEWDAAAFTLGVAHGAGGALYCLLAKLATLVPLGEVALRVNLLSALAAALVARFAFVAVRDLDRQEPAATLAGLGAAALWASGLGVVRMAGAASPAMPSLAALCLGIVLGRAAAHGQARAGVALGLLGGLGLGLDGALGLALGPPALAVVLVRLRRGDRWPLYVPAAFVLGAAVLAYLPLRAAHLPAPAVVGGAPRTLTGLLASLGGGHGLPTPAVLAAWAQRLEGQLGLPALCLAAVGVAALSAAPATRALGLGLGWLAAVDLAAAAAALPAPLADPAAGHLGALAVAVAAAAGVWTIAGRLGRAAPWAAAALVAMMVTPAALADLDGKLDREGEPGRWAEAALAGAPPRTLALVDADGLAGGLAYEQAVAGARPDVIVLPRGRLGDAWALRARLERGGNELRALASLGGASERERVRQVLALGLGRRPLLWEPGREPPPLGALEPGMPLDRVRATPAPLGSPRAEVARLEALLAPGRDRWVRRLTAARLVALGRLYAARDDGAAAALFEAALAVVPNDEAARAALDAARARR